MVRYFASLPSNSSMLRFILMMVLVVSPLIQLKGNYRFNPTEDIFNPTVTTIQDGASYIQDEATSNSTHATTEEVGKDKIEDPPRHARLLLGPIFYNVFIPSEPAGTSDNSRRIVQQQFLQVRNQIAAINTTATVALRYVLIGDRAADSFVQQQCTSSSPDPTLPCTQHAYLEEGGEEDTLQYLWEYCKDHPTEVVSYIHNKGSFNPSASNEYARRFGTMAAVVCQNLMVELQQEIVLQVEETGGGTNADPPQCTTCAFAFHMQPQFHGRANMWSARCDYVSNLLPPKGYAATIQTMYDTTLNHSILGYTNYNCLRPQRQESNHLGLGRYAMERWVFSHPFVRPCEPFDSQQQRQIHQRGGHGSNWKGSLNAAPPGAVRMNAYRSAFERLPGRLFEWNYLYKKEPPPDSWMWKHALYQTASEEFLQVCREEQRQKEEELGRHGHNETTMMR